MVDMHTSITYFVLQLAPDDFMHLLSDLEQEQAKGHQPKDNPPYRGREGVPVEVLCAGVGQQDGPALHGLGGGGHELGIG